MGMKVFRVSELFKTVLEDTEKAPDFAPTGGNQTNTRKSHMEQSKAIHINLCEQTRML